ncbi:MAG: transposase [Spirobacillus cienkowskii]|uniref:Transposase n=1 Tax=Spirobacillus cienkowskii TaxID=495820 RepID=A0A369KU50_9BACT|nr:MAG: transposase [Spirobacillus cienkowskii]
MYKEISERDSTRTCSKCSEILPRIGLGVRTWTCEKCNTIHDRDVNASINILNAYKNMFPIGQDRPTRTKKNSS